MLRFRGFKASLNFNSEKTSGDHYESSPGVTLTGAYRSSNEFVGHFTYIDPQKRIRPSMVKLPNLESATKPNISTIDQVVQTTQAAATNLRNDLPDTTLTNTNNIQLTKNQIKEQKNLERRRLAEQKKREKLAAQEQQKREKRAAQEQQKRDKLVAQEQLKQDKLAAREQQRQEKLRKEAEKQGQRGRVAQDKRKVVTRSAPKPPPMPPNPPAPISSQPKTTTYSTNTLESSISKTSGPPPYNAIPEVVPNNHDDTGNTSFGKPAGDSGSWDMISQHRQQLSRPAGVGKSVTKQTHLNLNYVAPANATVDNTDA